MVDRTRPGTLFDMAKDAAEDAFSSDDSGKNNDKVCAVALHISEDRTVSFFSGSPGYAMLVDRFMAKKGGDVKNARNVITQGLTSFLKSPSGGGFTDKQIKNKGFADHDRGAMNCAEPKLYYYVKHVVEADPGNWVVIPFNLSADKLVYNPPCGNCREWVYGHFHALSKQIAKGYGGGDSAVASKKP